jgi:hypothetical protein
MKAVNIGATGVCSAATSLVEPCDALSLANLSILASHRSNQRGARCRRTTPRTSWMGLVSTARMLGVSCGR